MTNIQMRSAVQAAYNTESWRKRVKKMSDAQITAIYLRLLGKGKIK